MTPFTLRGVPRSLRRDAWWLAADAQSGVGTASQDRFPAALAFALLGAVFLADLVLWQVHAGLGFVILILALAGIAQTVARDTSSRNGVVPWVILIAAVVPAIDLVQALSVILALSGLSVFLLLITGATAQTLGRAFARMPLASVTINVDDTMSLFRARPSLPDKGQILRDWFMPVSLGVVFAFLMVAANPVVERWLADVLNLQGLDVNVARAVFWGIAALSIWPLLRLNKQAKQLFADPRPRKTTSGALLNPRSLVRALIVFNGLFALQTTLDLTYLIAGAALPDGMTYATYAHRGAYPLLATALLAGAFAIIAQPMLGKGSLLRWLLLVWVGQTVLLVGSSILRLELYVAAYGLTIFRVAAFIWMGLVAVGLCLLIWQLLRRLDISWLMVRAAALGLGVIYIASLTNVSGYVATHNLNRTTGNLDTYYLCNMGQGATPAIAAFNQDNPDPVCRGRDTAITQPKDLREWGYRQHRLRSTLLHMQETHS